MYSSRPVQQSFVAFLMLVISIQLIDSNPTIDHLHLEEASNYRYLREFLQHDHDTVYSICIRNCAQCKKMFGPYFEGQLCGDTCVKFKGKLIPDCEDLVSIAPFLNKID